MMNTMPSAFSAPVAALCALAMGFAIQRGAPVKLAGLARCLGGGALMGWASLMIPGGNDTLVLVAMPLLRPYAWVAFAATCIATGTVSVAGRRLRAWRERARCTSKEAA
ncbi:hypothetical protein [Burkholderia sp. PU8-34]